MRSFALDIAGKTYNAQPLPLGALRDFTREGLFEKLAGSASGDPAKLIDGFEAIIRVISAALLPRYPECDQKWVADNVPAGPLGAALLAAVMRESGLVPEGDGGGNAASPSV
jgi:hypothetical protein